jgi:hypothetical protein
VRVLWFIVFFAVAVAVRGAGILPQQVYVWQRAWNAPVCDAVAAHATNFSELAVLSAEVSWKNKLPHVSRADVDYPVLAKTTSPVGLVLRVGPYNGRLSENTEAVKLLSDLASVLASEARAKRVEPVELQIDFDCAESKLDDYRI